jgi:NapC/NirT cytochrome c family, N-terminal region
VDESNAGQLSIQEEAMATDPQPRDRTLPSVFYNLRSVIGAWISGVSLIAILFLMLVELTSSHENPYSGILTFVIAPMFLIGGLALVAFGAIREHQRRKRNLPPSRKSPVLDMNLQQHRRVVGAIAAGSIVFLALSSYGAFKAYEYTETNAFCGEICHQVMGPEYTAYQTSAHARVHCVECHIGSGAQWFVKSKISGSYQVYSVLAKKFPKPIPTPVDNLRPSRDTCERCHWPAKFYSDKLTSLHYYLADEENTHMRLDMVMHIGGGEIDQLGPAKGIHWHMNIANNIEYVAEDERRQEIPWVRITRPDGSVSVYLDEESEFNSDAEIDSDEIRTMDCIDCHNRPSHKYNTPMKLVNGALARGEIDSSLPWVKSVASQALDAEYLTEDEAMAGIESTMRDELAEVYEERPEDVDRAVESVQAMYRSNYFPEMGVSWHSFPDNIGHLTSSGCFRCHDGMHVDESGTAISRECNVCHTFLGEQVGDSEAAFALSGVEYQHPEDIDGMWKEIDCTECHAP